MAKSKLHSGEAAWTYRAVPVRGEPGSGWEPRTVQVNHWEGGIEDVERVQGVRHAGERTRHGHRDHYRRGLWQDRHLLRQRRRDAADWALAWQGRFLQPVHRSIGQVLRHPGRSKSRGRSDG